MLCEVFQEAKLPAGVCNMIFGTGPKAGNALVSHPDVPMISFTGGTVTAERIIKSSAPYYKKLSLELGGKNPGIVFNDANIDECIGTLVRAGFSNQGEICLCSSRLFVQEGVYDEFVKKYTEEVKKIKVGDPREASTKMGPLVSKQHLEKVLSYVKLAQELGGKIECGGKQPAMEGELKEGYFLEPTVITGLDSKAAPCTEEIFGPVVTVTPFKTEEEVVEWANGVKYGLAASIWTENVSRMHRMAQEIHVFLPFLSFPFLSFFLSFLPFGSFPSFPSFPSVPFSFCYLFLLFPFPLAFLFIFALIFALVFALIFAFFAPFLAPLGHSLCLVELFNFFRSLPGRNRLVQLLDDPRFEDALWRNEGLWNWKGGHDPLFRVFYRGKDCLLENLSKTMSRRKKKREKKRGKKGTRIPL